MALYKFFRWVRNPDPPEAVEEALAAVTDNELQLLLHTLKEKSPELRLAWVEFGRRKGLVQFEIKMVRQGDDLVLKAEGAARPVHYGPLLTKN